MRVALVHDWLLRVGGAEKVLIALHRIFPEAPIYTLFFDPKFVSQNLKGAEVRASFLQKIPNIKKLHPWFKILMPSAVESLDFSGFDLVICSSHEIAHGVVVKSGTRHIAYYHSPSRLLWDRAHEYLNDFKQRKRGAFKLSLIRAGQHFLRLWDWSAAQRPDVMVANSKHVAARIKKYYGREAKVVYPPVEIPKTASEFAHRTTSARPTHYFLIVSQLYPHKNIDLAVRAFKDLPDLNLVIVGGGPEKKRLEKLLGESGNIKLAGFLPDEELTAYYKNCSAYLLCNEEDFGISPVEAMLHGKPVLALRRGGGVETVKEGITGEFFNEADKESLKKAVAEITIKIMSGHYSPEKIKKRAEKFGFENFKKGILKVVGDLK